MDIARLLGSGSEIPKLVGGIEGIDKFNVFDAAGANGGDSRWGYLAGAVSGGGICIGNWGMETEILGAIDLVIRFDGGSITKLPSYDRFLATPAPSTGETLPSGTPSEMGLGTGLVYVRMGECIVPIKPGDCI
jgi:hypothetical protein